MGKKKKYDVKFQKSPFPVEKSFEYILFITTPLIGEELKKIEKLHGRSLNHWVGGLINITVQTCYDLQYPTKCLSFHINAPAEPALLALRYGI